MNKLIEQFVIRSSSTRVRNKLKETSLNILSNSVISSSSTRVQNKIK